MSQITKCLENIARKGFYECPLAIQTMVFLLVSTSKAVWEHRHPAREKGPPSVTPPTPPATNLVWCFLELGKNKLQILHLSPDTADRGKHVLNFVSFSDPSPGHGIRTVPNGPANGTGGQRAYDNSLYSSPSGQIDRPRRNSRRRRGTNNGDDEDNQGARQRGQQHGLLGEGGPFLACHYYKLDPERYVYCLGRFCLRRSGDVKQHLQRYHTLSPDQCPFCLNGGMDGEVLRQHITICPQSVNPALWPDMLLPGQLEALQIPRGMTEEEKWYYIWDCLFSEHPRPDSPWVYGLASEIQGLSGRRLEAALPNHIDRLLAAYPLVDQHVLVALMREVTNIQYTAPPLAWQPLRQALNPAPSADAQVMPVLPDVQFSVQHYNAQQHYALEEPAPVDRHQINAAVAGEQLLPNGQQEQDDEFNHYVRCSPAGDN